MSKPTPFDGLTDRTPKYTVKDVADKLGMTTHTVRYYDNAALIPEVGRTSGNIRMFSDYNLAWFKLIHCLRTTGLPIDEVRRYIRMCLEGPSTIPQRAEIIFKQEKLLREQMKQLRKQMEVLTYKKHYYEELLAHNGPDLCNPQAATSTSDDTAPQEPNVAPR
jgi:MerR family transcriptional regulator, aldehyde-responsive regulator